MSCQRLKSSEHIIEIEPSLKHCSKADEPGRLAGSVHRARADLQGVPDLESLAGEEKVLQLQGRGLQPRLGINQAEVPQRQDVPRPDRGLRVERGRGAGFRLGAGFVDDLIELQFSFVHSQLNLSTGLPVTLIPLICVVINLWSSPGLLGQ